MTQFYYCFKIAYIQGTPLFPIPRTTADTPIWTTIGKLPIVDIIKYKVITLTQFFIRWPPLQDASCENTPIFKNSENIVLPKPLKKNTPLCIY